MTQPIHLIYSPGTRIVTRNPVNPIGGGPRIAAGAVAEILQSPIDAHHGYKVRLNDGTEAMVRRSEFSILKEFRNIPFGVPPSGGSDDDASSPLGPAEAGTPNIDADFDGWKPYIIYRCITGSQAYGLNDEASDVDRRGIYLPPAELHWSLYGVPEQIQPRDTEDTAETYWELQKFLVLALKANPNILECLHSPLVEFATPLAEELLANRKRFLSKIIYQTYNGYVMGQFKKLEQDLRARGEIKWKHAMHLIRLLLTGITTLRECELRVRLDEHRPALLSIKRGDQSWPEINTWRLRLHKEFEEAYAATQLPERPDYEWANAFLVRARRASLNQ